MEYIRLLVISLVLLVFPVSAVELLLHWQPVEGRVLLLVLNRADEPFIIDEDSFRMSANGRLHFDFRDKDENEFPLVSLLNDRIEPYRITVNIGEIAGQFFYLEHLLQDYNVTRQGVFYLRAFICENTNFAYENMDILRREDSCLVSNEIELGN